MRKIALILLVGLLLGVIFQKPLITHLKIALFISEEFPQIPIKPLGLISVQPFYNKVEFDSVNGKVVADLFIPNQILRLPSVAQDKAAVLILAMGVKTSEKDKPILLHFANTMARLGYVTFWPRLEVLDKGESLPEEPETFIEGFKYLEKLPKVDPKRISYVGFSVGSSTAFVAISNPEIANKVHSLVFFGGYFDVFDYLSALDGQSKWRPHQDAINHAKTLLVAKGVTTISAELRDSKDAGRLKKYSPKEFVPDFKAKINILHDKSDTYVPYTQSIKLYESMGRNQIGAYHISDLFEHVQPNRPIKVGELVKLYGFLYKVFSIL